MNDEHPSTSYYENRAKEGTLPDAGANAYAQQLECNRQRILLMDLDKEQKTKKLEELSKEIEALDRLYHGK